jgi:hypothetical protein
VKYAVGGEVPIDMSSESTPEATIQKMETVRRAALAPADPSPADLQIASAASAKEIQAMQELQANQRDKASTHNASVGRGTSSIQKVKGTADTNIPISSTPYPVGSGSTAPGYSRQMIIQTYQTIETIT